MTLLQRSPEIASAKLRACQELQDAWKADHELSTREFPGGVYYLLHTLSHLLMTTISLDCGYPASSLRERIYALPGKAGGPGRFGILLFTASSDAEGTLGGCYDKGGDGVGKASCGEGRMALV